MALEEDLPEKPEDKTIPKYKQIAKVRFSFCAHPGDNDDDGLNGWTLENSFRC